MAAKYQRVVDIKWLNGGQDAVAIEYNPASGGQKSLIVGPRLLPIPIGAATWTTDVSGGVILPESGMILAIYNNSGANTEAVTISNAATTAQAIGDVDTFGNVGIAIPSRTYVYLAMGNNQYIISNSSSVVVYIMEDPTRIIQQTPPLVPQNVPGFVPPVNS